MTPTADEPTAGSAGIPSSRPLTAAARPRRSLLLTLGVNFGIMGLNVVSGSVNARVLGPSGRGELAAIQTIPSVLGMIALLGLPTAVAYLSAKRPGDVRALTLTAVIIFLMAVAPLIIAGYLLMPMALRQQPQSVVGDARLYLVFVALHLGQFPYHALQGLGRFGVWNLLRPVPNLIGLAALAIAYGTGHPRAGTLARWYLLLYAATIPVVYAVLWRCSRRGGRVTTALAREMLNYGLPSAIVVPATLLNLQLDQMIMAAWLPSQLLGLYVIGVSWSGLLSPVFGALGSIVFPTLAATQDLERQRAVVGRSFRLALLTVVILGLGLAAVTPLLLPLLFGRSFALAVPCALLLILAGIILNLSGLSGEVLRGVGAPRWPLFSQLAALPVTVGLLVVLLPRWEIVGAAVSSIVAYLIALVVALWGIRRTVRLSFRDMLLPRREDYSTLWGIGRDLLARLFR